MSNQGKLFKTLTYLGLSFVKSLPRFVNETHGPKLSMSFNLFIAILCARISSVYRALKDYFLISDMEHSHKEEYKN